MAEYDVVVVGAGTNGLLAAAYLAKAGLNVCLVEKQPFVGGGALTREIGTPGFKHDVTSIGHLFIQPNPVIKNDELGLLSKYGLKYIFPEVCTTVIFPDDRQLSLYYPGVDKTCAAIEEFSKKDAEAYQKFYEWSSTILEMLLPFLYSPPLPFGTIVSMLEGSEEGRDIIRALMMSPLDIANEWFESDAVKTMICRVSSEAAMGPAEQGTAFVLFAMVPLISRCGFPLPEGGSGMLSEATAACVRDLGGTIRTSSPVKRIKVEGGQAKGVILESGEEILAKKAVVSALHVKRLFLQLVDAEHLPADFPSKVKRIKPSTHMFFAQHLELNEAPKFKAGGDANRSFWPVLSPYLEEALEVHEGYKRGLTTNKLLHSLCCTLHDPTRAPAGKHTLYTGCWNPYYIKGGPQRWDEIKQELADSILEKLREHTTNMGDDNILWRGGFMTPLDLERQLDYVEGDFMHIGHYIHQLFSNRPLMGWGHFKTPIERLYMCGASCYPGAGVNGGARSAMPVVMEDLGIDFEKVIA